MAQRKYFTVYCRMETYNLPDTGKMISDCITNNRVYKSALTRYASVKYKTLVGYTKQKNLSTHNLYAMSMALKHNFFADIAATMPSTFMPVSPENNATEVIALQSRVTALEIEVKTLENALRILGGK